MSRLAHDTIVRATTMDEIDRKLIVLIGLGGTGKSTTVNAVITTLKQKEGWSDENYAFFVMTAGLAATNIHGSTVHSWKEGLGFPVGKAKFQPLSEKQLDRLQSKFKDKLWLVILDEYSMLRQKEFFYMNSRLIQIMCSQEPLFGGITIVKGNAVWNKKASNKGHDADGYSLYQFFGNFVKLEKNVRIDPNDRDARDGKNTEEDVKLVRKLCSRHSMPANEWKEEVNEHNCRCITKLGKPIASIQVSHTGRGKKFSKEHARGLLDSTYLAVGAKILVTQNITTYVGICNGSTGIVKDIVYAEGMLAPSLPQFVIVDFGNMYTGPPFFGSDTQPERRGWVPIKPVTYSWYTPCSKQGFEEHSWTMLPLTTAWAFTIWKSQVTMRRSMGSLTLHFLMPPDFQILA
eukprot:scaffold46862_cov30-Attheya_sp.AAC.2